MDSVPPSVLHVRCGVFGTSRPREELTCESGCDKDRRKTSDPVMERSSWESPVLSSDIVMISVAAAVDHNPQNHKDDNGNHFQQTEPILELHFRKGQQTIS